MANDNKRKLYDALSQDYDMGTYEQFCADLNDEKKRRKLYDATSKEYDYGSYDSFSSQLGYNKAQQEAQQPTSKPEATKPAQTSVAQTRQANQAQAEQKAPQYEHPQNTYKVRRGGRDFAISADEVAKYGNLAKWAAANPGAPLRVYMKGKKADGSEFNGHVALGSVANYLKSGYKYQDFGGPMTDEQKAAAQAQLNAMQQDRDARFDAATAHNKVVADYNAKMQGTRYGQTMEQEPSIRNGQVQNTYVTPQGDVTTNKDAADMITREGRLEKSGTSVSTQQAKAGTFFDTNAMISTQIRDAEARLKDVSSRMEKRLAELTAQHRGDAPGLMRYLDASATSSTGMATATNPEEYAEVMQDDTYNTLRLQKRKIEEEIQLLHNAKDQGKHGFLHDFFRNAAQQVTKMDAWDLGKGQLRDATAAARLAERVKKSPDNVSDTDFNALNDIMQLDKLQSVYGDLGRGARWGDIAGQSLSFMKDFILTGGFSGISTGLSTKLAAAVAERAASRVGTNAAKEVAGKIAKDGLMEFIRANGKGAVAKAIASQGRAGLAATLTTKALGVGAEDLLIRAPLMTGTVQGMSSLSGIIDTKYGKVGYNQETGEYEYQDEKDWSEAAWQSGMDQVIENYSEMWGAHLPALTDVSRVLGAKKLTAAILRSTREGAGTILSKTASFLERGGVNGYFGEVGEEYYGQLWKTMLGLDSANDESGRNQFFNKQFHEDIWGGMAMSIGMTGAGHIGVQYAAQYGGAAAKKAGEGVLDTAVYLKHKNNIRKANSRAMAVFDADEWDNLRTLIDGADNDGLCDVAKKIMDDKSMTDEQRDAAMDYAEKSMVFRGYNLGELLRKRAGEEKSAQEEEINQSFLDGYDAASSPEEMRKAQADYDQQLENVKGLFGDSAVADLDNSPVNALKNMKDGGMYTQEEIDAARDYVNAKIVRDGIFQAVSDDIEDQITQSDAKINSQVNTSTGTILPATLNDDRSVFIVGGKVALKEDGTIDKDNSEESLIVRDATTGKIDFTDAKYIMSIAGELDAEEQKQAAAEQIRQAAAQAASDNLNGKLSFAAGEVVTVPNGNGSTEDLTIISPGVTEDGQPIPDTVVVEYGDGKRYLYKMADLQQAADAARAMQAALESEQRNANRAQADAERAAADDQQPTTYALNDELTLDVPEVGPIHAQVTREADEDGKVEVTLDMPDGTQQVRLFTPDELANMTSSSENAETRTATDASSSKLAESEQQTGEQPSALERVPKDEQGNPDYVQADADTAWDAIVEQANGDEDIAVEIANEEMGKAQVAVDEAEKALEETQNAPAEEVDATLPIAERIAAKKRAKDEKDAAVAQAQSLVDAAKSVLEHWANISNTRQRRTNEAAAAAEEEARRKAAEQAQKEREAMEAANGVPDFNEDNGVDARKRGYVIANGQKVTRQEEFGPDFAGMGKEVNPMFRSGAQPVSAKGRIVIAEAEQLQPSHVDGHINPKHFIYEAQPKKRHDDGGVSMASADKNASNLNVGLVTRTDDAYAGAPVVNMRGEGVQGNGRLQMFRYLYSRYKEKAEEYKQWLVDHADELGVDAEYIKSLKHPVMVMALETNDEEAINLGQYTSQDMESGGVERIKADHTINKLGDQVQNFADQLLKSEDEDEKLIDLIRNNGRAVLDWMRRKNIITDTQYASAFKSNGALTDDAAEDLQAILFKSIFKDGANRIEDFFKLLPAKAQKAILSTAHRDFNSPVGERMISEIQNSIVAYWELSSHEPFKQAKDYETCKNAVRGWIKQAQINNQGETVYPSEKFSNFAIELATSYKGLKQTEIQRRFNAMYDLIQGTVGADLFNDPDNVPRTLAQAIKEVLNIEYVKPNSKTNGNNGGITVAVGPQTSEAGGRGSTETDSGGEQTTPGGQSTDAGAGASGDSSASGGRGDLQSADERSEGEEVDHKGHPFVKSEDGTTIFGNITDDMGLTAAPIKLSVGEQNEATSDGYGLVHIEANHGKDILNAGFKSVEDFVSYVAKNFDPDNIRVGKKRKNGSPTYLILVTDAKHDNTLYIELSQDGAYWNVNSGGIFRKGYSNKRETVAKTEPQQPNNAVSSDSSLSADEQVGTSSTEPNGESSVSDDKGNTLSSDKQEDSQESSEDDEDWAKDNRPIEERLNDANERLDYALKQKMAIGKVREQIMADEEGKAAYEEMLSDLKAGKETTERKEFDVLTDIWGSGAVLDAFRHLFEHDLEEYGKLFAEWDYLREQEDQDSLEDTIKKAASYVAKLEKEKEAERVDLNPTQAQIEAGNYKKGHRKVDGLDITIENPKGSTRKGVDADGKHWENKITYDYGYIRGTEGTDGDHIDIFLSDTPESGDVYIVDQLKVKSGEFDEHKVMYGFNSLQEAKDAYLSNYSEGWQGLGNITKVSREEFKKWIKSSHRKTKPFADYASVKKETEAKPANEEFEDRKDDEDRELTEDEITNSGMAKELTLPALEYLKGNREPAIVIAYITVKDYVRNQSRNSAPNSTDADTTQLGGEDDAAGAGPSGRGGGSSVQVDNEDGAGDVPGDGLRGTDSEGDVAATPGEGGNSGVSSGTPANVRKNSGGGRRSGGSVRRSDGPSGGRNGRGHKGSGAVSDTDGRGTNASADVKDALQSELDAELKKLKDLLKDSLNPPRDKAYDVTTLMANLGVNAAKAFVSAAKIGGILVRMGIHRFNEWRNKMHQNLDQLLSETKLTPEQVDEFIKAMWNCPYELNGEVHKISEWAAMKGQEELREMMKMSIEEKRELQKKAEGKKTILCDIDNIREALPFLLPAQQEDVLKAETQFFDDSHKNAEHGNGKGYMFTNGTGTGKTYTGLGIAKRFINQGKKRILIVTAQESKINDFIRDAKNLGIEASMLQDTKTKGAGVVVTQYANMYQNYALLEDTFDLVIYDESHKLMENQYGSETSRARMHHMICNRDAQQVVLRKLQNTALFSRAREIESEIDDMLTLLKKADMPSTALSKEDIKTLHNWGSKENIEAKINSLRLELTNNLKEQERVIKETLANKEKLAEAQKEVDHTKVVFLSATPFNTALNLDYVEGYIFSYPREGEQTSAYESAEERQRRQGSFVIDKFGSSHKRSGSGMVVRMNETQITDPDKASEEEIAFSDYLQNDLNVMSGRALDSEYDYSREFPKLSDPASTRINQAISDLTRGQFKDLAPAFNHLLNDYPTMTALFEIIKTKQSIERIKEHLAQGRKVAVYHRRRESQNEILPPFITGITKAKADRQLSDLADQFAKKYADLLQWEKAIDYSFPNEQIVEAFATQQEKAAYAKELVEWARKCTEADAAGKKLPAKPRLKAAAVAEFNGKISQKEKDAGRTRFNDDNSDCKIMVCQIASAKEGIDLHDKTGQHQRVLISLALPQSPIEFIQVEGRIYRIGSKSDAIFEYPILGIDLEIASFAMKINGRSQTEENLALGSKSRGLRDSIMRAVLGSREIPVTKVQGKGGKALDNRALQNKTGYEDAITDYSEWSAEKLPEDFDDMEVPNPIGYKMIEWAKSEAGESLTVPYARRGTIAKYAPGKSRLVVLEDDMHNYSQLAAMLGGGGRKIINESFKDYAVVNKTDCLVMNGPHSKIVDKSALISREVSQDATNVLKAWKHLEEGGRIVALLDGTTNIGKIEDSMVMSAEVLLPDFVFGGHDSRIVIIDKVSNKELRDKMPKRETIDLSDKKDMNGLFAALKAIDVPSRTIDKQYRIKKRVTKAVAQLVNSPIVGKSKDSFTHKLTPDIYNSQYKYAFYLKSGYHYVPDINRNGGVSMYNCFDISYQAIADNDLSYIEGLARNHQFFRKVSGMSYEELRQSEPRLAGRIREKDWGAVAEAYTIFANAIEAALNKTNMQMRNIAEGKVENEVHGTMDVDEFQEAFRSLNNDNVEMSTLADRVFAVIRQVKGLKFRVVDDTSQFSHDNTVAHYSPGKNAIELNNALFNSMRIKDDMKASTIVHEMIHALSCYLMRRYDEGDVSGMNEAQRQACADIFSVYENVNNNPQFKAALRQGTKLQDNAEYGLTNAYELLAETANPVFRNKLKEQKLWQYLINGQKRLLSIGIPGMEADEETDALSVLDKSFDTLLNEFDGDLYDSYVGPISAMEAEEDILTRPVTDKKELERLNSEPTIVLYCGMQKVAPGDYLPPMSAKVSQQVRTAAGKERNVTVFRTPSQVQQWERSEEEPERVNKDGKFPLNKGNGKTIYAAYNPYFHASNLPINDQFSSAWDRPELVVVKVEIPVSELTSGYRANKAEKAVGEHDWKKGPIGNALAAIGDVRKVFLSRWRKVVGECTTDEVADEWARHLKDTGIGVPFNTVTPQVRDALVARGIEITEPEKGNAGDAARPAYERWKNEVVHREGSGAYSDEEVSYANDPISKAEGRNRFSKKRQAEFAVRERQRIANRVQELAEKLHLDNVEILEDTSTLTGKRATSKGFYNRRTDKITIVLSNNLNATDAAQTLLHEAVGHFGLRQLFGKEFDTFLDNVFEAAETSIREKIVELSKKYQWNIRTATEEYLASLAEDTNFEGMTRGTGWWEVIKEKFLKMLSRLGLKDYFANTRIVLSDNELRYLLWRSYENLAEPGKFRSILGHAADVAMQDRLQVGDYKTVGNTDNAAESDYLLRDGDFSPRDRVLQRTYYNRMVQTGGYQFKEAVQDSMLGLKTLYQAITEKYDGKMEDIPGYENAYLFENRMSSMNAGEQHEYFVHYMKPLLSAIAGFAGSSKRRRRDLMDYMMAKHGLERNAYMRAQAHANGEDTSRDFAGLTGLTNEPDWMAAESIATQWVEDFEKNHDADQVKDLWEAVNAATKATLMKIYNSGLLTSKSLEKVQGMYKYYIPLRGWDETTSDQVYGYLTGNDGLIGGSVVKKAEGRSSMADDPIATIAMMADDAIRQGNRNLMKQRFLNFVLNHPSDAVSVHDLWLQKNEVTGLWQPVFADLEPNDTAEDVERKVDAFEETMKELAEKEPENYKRGREASNIPYKVVKGNQREHQVMVKRAGRTYVLTINGSPRAAQAINGLTNPDVEQSGVVGNMLKLGEWLNRQLSAFYTTRNPDFVVSNFFRDAIYSNCMTWVKETPKYAVHFHRNFGKVNPAYLHRLIRKWDNGELSDYNYMERMFKQFMLNGGETGYTNVRDIEQHKKEVQQELRKEGSTGRKAWAALGMELDRLNRAAENCARFAAFITSREMGRDLDRAIYDAKEISVNFNKKGSGGKMVNANGQTGLGKFGAYLGGGGRLLYVFWNAGLQGMTNFLRQGKRHPIKFTAGAAALFGLGYVIPMLAQMMGSGDGDDGDKNAYYNLPEYIRRSNICFKAGDQWITIPLPIEYRSFYGLGELASGVISKNERYSDNELAFQMASQVSQILPLDMLEGGGGISPMIPSVYKPFTEAYILNRSWTGMPIYRDSEYLKNSPEWTKAYASTDKHLVDFARWLNSTSGGDDYKKGSIDINPAKIEYLLSGTFGGMYSFPLELKKTGETIFGARDFEWRNIPIAKRLVKSGDERTANRKLQNEYFNYRDEYEKTAELIRKYENAAEEDKPGYEEKLNRLVESPEYARWEIFKDYKDDLDAYRHDIAAETDEEKKKQLQQEMYDIIQELVGYLRDPDKYFKEAVQQ